MPQKNLNLVSRPHLLQRLDDGLAGKLILVSAAAGFGKTTLVSSWVSEISGGVDQPSVGWLSLDDDDNDPIRFLSYLLAALEQLAPQRVGQAQAKLRSAKFVVMTPPYQPIINALINDLVSSDRNFILVLDDYHRITASAVHETLTFLLDYMPSQLHLVIISRSDPPLPLSRLRADNEVIEVRTADLRFSIAETTSFLNGCMKLNLSTQHVAELQTRTEGWVAGLLLFILTLRKDDLFNQITNLSGRHNNIADYLAEEVLSGQPAQIQEFLLQTAILERLSSSLCDAVAGRTDSQSMLATIERHNLFIIPLDQEQRWYRYHDLFADFLRLQARQKLSKAQLAKLHEQAATWYEGNGFLRQAVKHALQSDDPLRAAELIEQMAPTLVANSELTTLQQWIAALPTAVVHTYPRLCLEYSWALYFMGSPQMSRSFIQAAEAALYHKTDLLPQDREALGILAALKTTMAGVTSDLSLAVQQAKQAEVYLPEDNLEWRSSVAVGLGLAHLANGNLAEANQQLIQARRLSLAYGQIPKAILAESHRGHAYALQGRLRQAVQVYQQAINLTTERNGHLASMSGMAYVGLGETYYQWNDLDTAAETLRQGIELGQQWRPGGAASIVTHGYMALALLRQAQGNHEVARQVLQAAHQAALQVYSADILARLETTQVKIWLAQGDLASAVHWAETMERKLAEEAPANGELNLQHQLTQMTIVRVRLVENKLAVSTSRSVLANLSHWQEAAQVAERLRTVLEILTLRALIHQSRGEMATARTLLTQALSQAEPAGYIRLFVDEGPPMTHLLLQIVKKQQRRPVSNVSVAYLEQLLTALDVEVAKAPDPRAGLKLKVEPLTDREVEILNLIATGLTNREIAETLIVSPGTVKKHISNIYRKLGVRDRNQAIVHAQAQNIIQKINP